MNWEMHYSSLSVNALESDSSSDSSSDCEPSNGVVALHAHNTLSQNCWTFVPVVHASNIKTCFPNEILTQDCTLDSSTAQRVGNAVLGDGGKGTPALPFVNPHFCLLYTSPSPRDRTRSRMPSSA